MADNLNLRVTAEGVETDGQMDLLQKENCFDNIVRLNVAILKRYLKADNLL
jgi:EAL domain-containing protein (putative c-di-GMP-specific phosphodiesterase class I)